VSSRVSQTVLLCEDDEQERLVRFYMHHCGLKTDPPYLYPINASRKVHGGNVTWVIREFPKQLEACRKRHAAYASTLLIVVMDADQGQVVERRGQLICDPAVSGKDPLVVLIPRRHIETWIRAALNIYVDETTDYKNPVPTKSEVRVAVATIHSWARDNPQPGPTCVPSLKTALPEWRKIG
jgi:hypothetical protein